MTRSLCPRILCAILLGVGGLCSASASNAQALPVVKVAFAEAGASVIMGSDLIAAVPSLAGSRFERIRLYQDLRSEQALTFLPRSSDGILSAGDSLVFSTAPPGEESWAYEEAAPVGVGSLYLDSVFVWIALADEDVPPFVELNRNSAFATSWTKRATRYEADAVYFAGASSSSGNPLYTQAEGYYEQRLSASGSVSRVVDLRGTQRDSLEASIRVVGGSGASHGGTLTVWASTPTGDWTRLGD